MDELVKSVADKVGISEAQAQQAVDMVFDYLNENLPEPYAGHLDALLEGDLSGLADLTGGLGKLFG
jgi:hypothetical protein